VIGALSLRHPAALLHHDHSGVCADGLLCRPGRALRAATTPDHLQAQRFRGLINLSNRVQFYYLCLFCLFGRDLSDLAHRQFALGMVVQGLRFHEARMQAIGFPATRYRLACFVISGTMCGLAGALLADNTDFVSPR